MKQMYLYALVLPALSIALFASFAVVLNAQTSDATSTVATSTSTAIEATSTITTSEATSTVPTNESAASTSEASSIDLSALQKSRLTNLCANISNRLEASLDRLGVIAQRMQSRAMKLQAEGRDVSSALFELTQAEQFISGGIENLEGIDLKVLQMVNSQVPAANWESIKSVYIITHENTISGKEALNRALALLKEAAEPEMQNQ